MMKNVLKRILFFSVLVLVYFGFLLFTLETRVAASTMNTQDYLNEEYFEEVKRISKEFDVDPYLIAAIIKQESNWNPVQTGGGLMQVSWDLYNTIGIEAKNKKGEIVYHQIGPDFERFNVENNIKYGVMKISNLLELFDGNVEKTIQAYNFNLSGYMQLYYPKEWENGQWLKYREDARKYYAEAEQGWEMSRSASSYCFSDEKEMDYDIPQYGDTCYIENVMRYYIPLKELEKKQKEKERNMLIEQLNNTYIFKQFNFSV